MKILVKVPASTSNLGPGFDVLGLALELYNEMELQVVPADKDRPAGPNILILGEGERSLPRDKTNVVWKCMDQILKRFRFPTHRYQFSLRFTNRLPLARGLGSSAAARLGGVLAANAVCGGPLSLQEITDLATELEGHPDNVVPSLYGGLCISTRSEGLVRFIRMTPPKDLAAVVCIPEFELSTEKARSVLPETVSRKDAVHNISRVSMLLGAIATCDYKHLKVAMEDRIHQNYRKGLIPGFDAVLKNGYEAGAYGVALSGAGPSIFAFSPVRKAAQVGIGMERGFRKAGRKSRSLVLKFCAGGSQIMYN